MRANKTYPVCIGAGRAAPPEDCDGAEGFMLRQDHGSEINIHFRLLELRGQIRNGEGPDDADLGAEVRQLQYWLTVKH
jgi:hypothetical protein